MNENSRMSMEFPASMNSYHRSHAHRFCDEHGLNHESIGVGNDRKLVISKENAE